MGAYWCFRIGFAQSEMEGAILLRIPSHTLLENCSARRKRKSNLSACAVFSSVVLPIVIRSGNESVPEIEVMHCCARNLGRAYYILHVSEKLYIFIFFS